MKREAALIGENPLRASYWLGTTSPEPLAAFRIALGLALLHDALNFYPNIAAFLSDDGILPRGAFHGQWAWSVFDWVGSSSGVMLVFTLGVAAIAAFTLGYRTRLATALSFVFVCSIYNRNPFIDDGGDDLVRNLLFLSLFADLGGCYSLDVRSGRRARSEVMSVGLRFLQLHVAVLYFCAGRLKFRAGWLSQNVIYRCLQLIGFVRPPGALLAGYPTLCYLLGVLTLGLELVFAFFAMSPFFVGLCRALAIAASLGVQLGILSTMRVGIFTEVMIATNLLFVPARWLQALERQLRARFFPASSASATASTPALLSFRQAFQERRVSVFLFALLAFNFLSVVWGPFVARRFPAPAWLGAHRRVLPLDQPFGLFDRIYPVPTWSVSGRLPGGEQVDVLPVTVPKLVPRVAWSFSRWYKFTFVVQDHPFPYRGLAEYLCAEFEKKNPSSLESLELSQTLTIASFPNEPQKRSAPQTLWRQRCRK